METEKFTSKIEYPYIPEGKVILYVLESNTYIQAAKKFAQENSLDDTMPTGSVVVKKEEILGLGANGSDYHKTHECERVKRNIPTGEMYELCEGCHPKNHSEIKAIKNAIENGKDPKTADLYLWGHWWCCEACWNEMKKAGIKDVYLMKESQNYFNKLSDKNIVGHQFDNTAQ